MDKSTFLRFKTMWLVLVVCPASLLGQDSVSRPPITGVSHVAFYAADPDASKHFYADLLGLVINPARQNVYEVGMTQAVELEPLPPKEGANRIAHVAFATRDADAMRRYLQANGIKVPDHVNTGGNGALWFALNDPDGHPIEFIQEKATPPTKGMEHAVSQHMIHAGFVVHDRAAEDRFYKDLLGFHLYWHGGMKDNETDWVDMQVPDGTDWLEYMLVKAGEQPSPRVLGILNHIALGVPKMSEAANLLKARGWKPSADEKPQIGKDGKWQLNLYDPDGTRVELMEFAPVQAPCCSPYVGRHPQ